MVNTGKPSSGCSTCRRRKIKCDERRPICFRCEKSDRICEGWPKPQLSLRRGQNVTWESISTPKPSRGSQIFLTLRGEVRFEETQVLSQRANTVLRVSPGRTLTPEERGPEGEHTIEQLFLPSPKPFAPIDLDEVVLSNLFHNQAVSGQPMIVVADGLLKTAPLQSTLRHSILALSWINAPIHQATRDHVYRARLSYAEALSSLRTELTSPVPPPIHQTLLAVLVMFLLEYVLAHPSTMGATTARHLEGALRFVDSRCSDKARAAIPEPIRLMILNHMVLHCVRTPTASAQSIRLHFPKYMKSPRRLEARPRDFGQEVAQVGVAAAEMHLDVREHFERDWEGVTDDELYQILARGSQMSKFMEALTDMTCTRWSASSQSASRPNTTRKRPNLVVPRERGQLLTSRFMVYVAQQRCIDRLLEMLPPDSLDDQAAKNSRDLLLYAKDKIIASMETLAHDTLDMTRRVMGKGPTERSGRPPDEGASTAATIPNSGPRLGVFAMVQPLCAIWNAPGISQAIRADVENAASYLADYVGFDRAQIHDMVSLTMY